ncbi:DUF6585 family protein [Actinomadura verrucosospora]|uniref:Uncharacterized protein n=1 Tax=Actinomadura verrucosospora TaxID=46165 RepID=A0A7D3VZH3_ACTVE|nr:DUF6585 family protein [Actinomadura verrucosospora]QKG22612.1 hypothetical protein ACTIVE_4253 [Actinomadura verrucosospora]
MADPSGLGEPVRTFDARPARRHALTWLITLALAVVALVPAAVAAFLSGRAWLGAPLTLIAMGCAAAAGWIAGCGIVWRRAPVVHLFTGGLLLSPAPSRSGKTALHSRTRTEADAPGVDGEVFVWDDLVSVTVSGIHPWTGASGALGGDAGPLRTLASGPAGGTRWRFTVVTSDGRVLRFGEELPGVRMLGEAIAAEVTRRVVPRHLAAVKAGEAIRLGPFTVDREGLEKDGQRLGWPAVREVAIADGLVTVHSHDGHPDLVAVAGHMPDALPFTLLCVQMRELLDLS